MNFILITNIGGPEDLPEFKEERGYIYKLLEKYYNVEDFSDKIIRKENCSKYAEFVAFKLVINNIFSLIRLMYIFGRLYIIDPYDKGWEHIGVPDDICALLVEDPTMIKTSL